MSHLDQRPTHTTEVSRPFVEATLPAPDLLTLKYAAAFPKVTVIPTMSSDLGLGAQARRSVSLRGELVPLAEQTVSGIAVGCQTWNDEPQPHVPDTFGLPNLKPDP